MSTRNTRDLIAFAKRHGVTFEITKGRLIVRGIRHLSRKRQGEIRVAREAIWTLLVKDHSSKEPATMQGRVDQALVAMGLEAGVIRVDGRGELRFTMTGGRRDDVLREAVHSIAPLVAAVPDPEPPPADAKLPHGKLTIWR